MSVEGFCSVTSESTHELSDLLDVILVRYQYDFRAYARASLVRRVGQAVERMGLQSIEQLSSAVTDSPRAFTRLLDFLTIPYSDMFRDSAYYLALREHVIPVLATYPSLRVWIAGCSTGEEVYSLAIVLAEHELLARTTIYATDIHPGSIARASAGIFKIDRVRQFSENYRAAGGKGSLSDYFQAAHGAVVFDRELTRRVVFSDHSLATDSVFAEVQLVSCRNVLIYFNSELQNRALQLFRDSLCRRGFLGLGSRETLRFTSVASDFETVSVDARMFQRRG